MWRIKARDLADKPVLFVLLTDSFIAFICKTIETSILNVNSNNFQGPLIIGTFEKRVHGALIMITYFASSFTEMNIFSPFEFTSTGIKIGVWINSPGLNNLGRP